jgi:phenylalanyl-tRNA synthetase beta chain
MKLSLNWLKEYLPFAGPVDQLVEALIFSGVEVDDVQGQGADFDKVVVAQIESFAPHPNADRLSVCQVNDGSGMPRQVVCAAKNFKAGDKAPLALPGAVLPGGFKIKASKLRGIESEGMLCSAKELTLAEDAAGILILPESAEIGKPLGTLFPSDTIIEVETTPNRPDLLSHYGIARELSALLDRPRPSLPAVTTGSSTRNDPSVVRVDAVDACPYYTARFIRGVKVQKSPAWLQRRLEAAGVRSINNVVDITNYVLLELGAPLHAFDATKIRKGIVVRKAVPNEKLLALDGKEYELLPGDLVIADHERALVIAGVMGGEESGVTESTTDVLLEAAYFMPGPLRKTSRRLGLISESSFRFERGIDPEIVLLASRRATDLIVQHCGGQAEPEALVAGAAPRLIRSIRLRPERSEALIGMKVPDYEKLLTRLGLKSLGDQQWETPSYRQDLEREIDLIEEVARMAGLYNIPSKVISLATTSSPTDHAHDDCMQLRQRLVGLGLLEARSSTLVDDSALSFVLNQGGGVIELRNPLASDQKILRPSLISGLVRAAERNFNRGSSGVGIFEIGRIFNAGETEERVSLSILVSGEKAAKSWNQPAAFYDFFDLKGILRAALGIDFQLRRQTPTNFAPLICDLVDTQNRVIGRIGQARPSLAKELGAKGAIFVSELALPHAPFRTFRYRALDRFPAVTRDVAFFAAQDLKYQDVLDTLLSANEPLLVEVRLFDVFVDPGGKKVPVDQKSMACSLTYRASDRTLTQDEVNVAHNRLKSQLVKDRHVTLRE